jgi:hypothetical protein
MLNAKHIFKLGRMRQLEENASYSTVFIDNKLIATTCVFKQKGKYSA